MHMHVFYLQLANINVVTEAANINVVTEAYQ